MRDAITARKLWLETKDLDNFYHVVDSIDKNTAPGPGAGGLKTHVDFRKNKPTKEWSDIMIAHLTELGYVVTQDADTWNIQF